MKRVALLVTGELEQRSLGKSLERLFRETLFICQRVDAFTTSRVPRDPPSAGPTPSAIDKCAAALVAAVDPGRKVHGDERFDLAFVIDDLELANWDQPEVVGDRFVLAVERHVAETWSAEDRRARTRQLLRDRASLHFLVPMTEAYFFADPDALARVGITAEHHFDPAQTDVEQFETKDPAYLGRLQPEKVKGDSRHPKRYVRFLLEQSGQPPYRETRDGVKGLETLDWPRAASWNDDWSRFLRALLCDLARGLGDDARRFTGVEHPATARASTLLRNM